MKICHLTSSHPRYDTRIFLKECSSLAAVKDFDVHLIVADGKGDERQNNVQIIDVGKDNSRKKQLIKAPKIIYKKAMELNADVYHFHDPELIFMANKLRKRGKKVIYDVHEDMPRAILTRDWLAYPFLVVFSYLFELSENFVAKKMIALITATPHISKRFKKISKNVTTINNFPILNELNAENTNIERANEVCYIGGIDRIRGIIQILDALELTDNIKLNLAGNFETKELEDEVKLHKAWHKVNFFGFVDRKEAANILARSKAGLVTFLPASNHIFARPNKMFEYMSAGLPIIASHFEDWKTIVEKYNTGICVNPESPEEIATAILEISSNEHKVKQLGENGKKAVRDVFNWESEAQKLQKFYIDLKETE